MDATPLTLGPGIFRLCRAGQIVDRAPRACASASFIRWRRAAPPSAPGSIPSRNSPRPSPRRIAQLDQTAVRQRAQQIRAHGRPRRLCVRARRAQRRRHRAVQDRQRHPPARLRPALGARRIDPAVERARLLDHAGQDQSDPERGADHGVLPGVRQSDHHHRRRQPGPFRAQRLQAGAGLLHAAIDPPARRRGAHRSPTIASSASRPTRRASAS